jgi:hypothetical protein
MNHFSQNKQTIEKRTICVDFDGTIAYHDFPHLGKFVPDALRVLKRLQQYHRIILYTMRHDKERPTIEDKAHYQASLMTGNHHNHSIPMQSNETYLTDAVNMIEEAGIKLYGVNNNKSQKSWSESPKVYGHLYIDDAALGCPLIYDISVHHRPYVDWCEVERWLINNDYLNEETVEQTTDDTTNV